MNSTTTYKFTTADGCVRYEVNPSPRKPQERIAVPLPSRIRAWDDPKMNYRDNSVRLREYELKRIGYDGSLEYQEVVE